MEPSVVDVSLWLLPLSEAPDDDDLRSLSAAEIARAERFVFPAVAARFVRTRAALRRRLADITGGRLEAIEIVEGEGGKPMLRGSDLQFNVSHTDSHGLIGVCRQARLGVDLERIRPIEADLIADFFAPEEQAALARLSGPARLAGLYRCWCRKEAFLKGLGVGLAAPLDEFAVSIDDPPTVIRCAFAPHDSWRLHAPDLGPELEAAISVESFGAPVHVTLTRLPA